MGWEFVGSCVSPLFLSFPPPLPGHTGLRFVVGSLCWCALMSTPVGSPCPTPLLFNHAALPRLPAGLLLGTLLRPPLPRRSPCAGPSARRAPPLSVQPHQSSRRRAASPTSAISPALPFFVCAPRSPSTLLSFSRSVVCEPLSLFFPRSTFPSLSFFLSLISPTSSACSSLSSLSSVADSLRSPFSCLFSSTLL